MLKERKKRIDSIIKGELTGRAARVAADAAAAVLATCILPVVISTAVIN